MAKILRKIPVNRFQTLSPAGKMFVLLLTEGNHLNFPRDAALAIWDMIQLSDDPEAAAFRYATTTLVVRLNSANTQSTEEYVNHYLREWLTPDLVASALDELLAREEIDNRVATRLHEQLDRWTTPHGEWLW